MRAARMKPVERTPVWFMRQAGRILPDYRAIRERYSLVEICRDPELCAEVTLQPVEQLGTDAAILFSDIMLPLIAVGVDLRIVDDVGPVIANPVRERAALDTIRAARAGARHPVRARFGSADQARARRQRSADRLLRSAVHARRVPGRGEAVARLRNGEVDDVRRAGSLARSHGATERHLHDVPASAGRSGRGRAAALRFVGRRALAGRLRGVRAAVHAAHILRAPRAGYPADPLRREHRDVASADAGRRSETSSVSTGVCRSTKDGGSSVTSAECRAISTQPCCSGRLITSAHGSPTCCVAPMAGTGHIFNLGHGLLPRTPLGNVKRAVELVRELSERRAPVEATA